MMRASRVGGLVLAAMLATSCGRSSPVAKNVDVPANSVGRSGGVDLERSTNAGGNERARKAAVPAPTDGMDWHWDEAAHAARFGVSVEGTTFSIACDAGRIRVRRFDAAPTGGRGTISFTGNGRVASLPAVSVGDSATLSSLWEAVETPSDRTQAVARVFDGPGPVEIALAGTTKLVTRPSNLPARAFAACRR